MMGFGSPSIGIREEERLLLWSPIFWNYEALIRGLVFFLIQIILPFLVVWELICT